MRIALIADSRLSPRSLECVANRHAARRAIEPLASDVTVHLGDITLDGQAHPEELACAAHMVQRMFDWRSGRSFAGTARYAT
ncbi:MAG: metallophosphoesterase, partial [Pseudomonadota bacterium]